VSVAYPCEDSDPGRDGDGGRTSVRDGGKSHRVRVRERVRVRGMANVHVLQIAIGIASGSGSLSGSKSTVAPTQWLAATSVMMAAIPIPIPMAIAMAPQWNPETHDLRSHPCHEPIARRADIGFDALGNGWYIVHIS
jgi:hypothetical protein